MLLPWPSSGGEAGMHLPLALGTVDPVRSCCPLSGLQNKKKMTREDFARINDNTNDGEPMPRELLSHIYQAIAKEELKISGGGCLSRGSIFRCE